MKDYSYAIKPAFSPIYHLHDVNISDPLFNTRLGKLLYHTQKQITCFGLKEGTNGGMVATTQTDKGEFWNGDLRIITGIK